MKLRDILRAGFHMTWFGKSYCTRQAIQGDKLIVTLRNVGDQPSDAEMFTFELDKEQLPDMRFTLNVGFSEELATNLLVAHTVPLDRELIRPHKYWSYENEAYRHFE